MKASNTAPTPPIIPPGLKASSSKRGFWFGRAVGHKAAFFAPNLGELVGKYRRWRVEQGLITIDSKTIASRMLREAFRSPLTQPKQRRGSAAQP